MRSAAAVTTMNTMSTLNLHVTQDDLRKRRELPDMTPTQCICRGMVAALAGFSVLLWAVAAHAQNCYPVYEVTTVTDPPVALGGVGGDAEYWDGNPQDCPRDYGVFYDELDEFQTNIVARAPLGAKLIQGVSGGDLDPAGQFGPHYAFWWHSPEYYGQWEFDNYDFSYWDTILERWRSMGGWRYNEDYPLAPTVISLPQGEYETYLDDRSGFAFQDCEIIIPKSPKGAFPAGQWTVKHLQYNLQVINKWKRIEADNQLTVANEPSDKAYQYRYRIAPHPFPDSGAWKEKDVSGDPALIDKIGDGFGVQLEPVQPHDRGDPVEEGCFFQNGHVFDYWRGDDHLRYAQPRFLWVPDITFPPAPAVPDETKSVTAVWKHDVELAIHFVEVGVYRDPSIYPEIVSSSSTVAISSESDSVDAPITSSEDFTVRLTHGYEFTMNPEPKAHYVFFMAGYAERSLGINECITAFLPGGTQSEDVVWLREDPLTTSFSVPEPAGPGAYYSGGVITVFFVDELLAQHLREVKAAIAKKLECLGITSWVGDPVYPHSGEFYQEEEDLRVKSPGMDFVWARKYSSRNGYDTVQGSRWDFNYNIYVERLGDEHLLYHDGNGRIDIFALSKQDGEWHAGGRTDRFDYGGGGSAAVLHMQDGTTQYFSPLAVDSDEPGGKLTCIRDRNGNTMSFYYDSEWHLTSVSDTLGRRYWIEYDHGTALRIRGVHEEYGDSPRSVRYWYDGDGNLTSAIGLGSGTTTYGYDNANNLTTITDPRRNTYLTNHYGSPLLSRARRSQVASQEWGNPGDTIRFSYDLFDYLPDGSGELLSGLSRKTTVTDRNGNTMDLSFGGAFLTRKDETEKEGGHIVTAYSYNHTGMPVAIQYPRGNRTLYEYSLSNQINPARVTRGVLNGTGGICQQFTYLPGLSGCGCGTSFIKAYTDGRGKVTTNDYDANGNLTFVHRPAGAGVDDEAYTYNGRGQVETHTWPGGRVDEFQYTGGYVTTVIQDRDGVHATVSLERDARGNVTAMTDAEQNIHSFEYDAHDRVTRIESPGAAVHPNVVSVVYDENGNATKVRFDNTGTGEWQEASYEYEILNYLKRSTLSGSSGTPDSHALLETTYEYDGNRNVTDIIPGGGGTPISFEYNARNMVTDIHRGDITISYEYDGNGNVTAVTYGGGRHEYSYDSHDQLVSAKDPLDNLTSLAYDANGNLAGVDRRDGGGKRLFAASYTYDDVNRLIERLVGNAKTELKYNGASELTDLINPKGHKASFVHDTMGRLESVSNDAGESASYEYDKNGNVLYATRKGLDGVPYTTGFTYDALNRLATAVDSANHQTTYGYDARSNLASVTGPDGRTSTFGYDGLNRLVEAVHQIDATHQATLSQTWDAKSRLASRTDGNSQTTRYDYDVLDRISAVTYADNTARSYEYYSGAEGGSLKEVIAPSGAKASFEYDALNRMAKRTVTKGALSETANFAYDGMSRLLSATVPGSRVSLEYDALGNLTAEALNGEAVRYTYDLAGNMETQTYPHGRSLSFAYDAAERLTGVLESGSPLVTYGFEKPHRLASKLLANGVTTAYTYDSALNVESVTAAKSGADLDKWGFAWDSVRNKTGRNDLLANLSSTYGYDGLQRLTDSTSIPGSGTILYALDAAGNRTGVTNGPDAGAYVLGAMHEYASAPVGGLTYDANGNLLTINAGQPNAQEFAYDAQDQLVRHVAHHAGGWQTMAGDWTTADDSSASGSGRIVKAREAGFDTLRFTYTADSVSTDAESYGFAAVRAGQNAQGCVVYVGVRIHGANIELILFGPAGETGLATASVTTEAGTEYDLALNIDATTGAVTLQRAAHGQALATIASASTGATGLNPDMLILGAGSATSYSFANVATYMGTTAQGELPDRPVTTTFQYDPFGRKVRKIVEGGVHPPQTTRYAYSGGRVLEEQDNTGTPKASYVYGRYIDEPIQMKRGDSTVYYHTDDLYNVTALTNAAGEVVERYRYDDFGTPHIYGPTGASIPESTVGNPYLFTGRAYDTDLGLYDYRTRHLHPGLGRFTTRDQIDLWGDPVNMGNPYSYVGNAPGKYVDPYGQTSLWDSLSNMFVPFWNFVDPNLQKEPLPVTDTGPSGEQQPDELTEAELAERSSRVVPAVREGFNEIFDWAAMGPSVVFPGGTAAVSGIVNVSRGRNGSAALDVAVIGSVAGERLVGTFLNKAGDLERVMGIPSSKRLKNSLIKAGEQFFEGCEAHHIVPKELKTIPEAEKLRDILQKFRIGLDDAENGIFLRGPKLKDTTDPLLLAIPTHRDIHKPESLQAMLAIMQDATTRQEAVDQLAVLRSLIRGGNL
jgi:RHS repeat-associated protein